MIRERLLDIWDQYIRNPYYPKEAVREKLEDRGYTFEFNMTIASGIEAPVAIKRYKITKGDVKIGVHGDEDLTKQYLKDHEEVVRELRKPAPHA